MHHLLIHQDDRWALHIEDAEDITLPDDGEIMPLGTSNWRYEVTVDLSIRHTLAGFIEMFGDAILDEALDPIGRGYPTSEAQIRVLAEAWQEQVIQEQFQEEARTMEEIVHTRHYARGVFQAEGDDLHEAGMIAFRWGKSGVGAIAYQKAIDAGKSIKQAWRAFWNTGTITSLNSSGVKVVSPANGKIQFCDWGLAAWKIANGEIYLTKDNALRLKGILSANRWGTDLISQL